MLLSKPSGFEELATVTHRVGESLKIEAMKSCKNGNSILIFTFIFLEWLTIRFKIIINMFGVNNLLMKLIYFTLYDRTFHEISINLN